MKNRLPLLSLSVLSIMLSSCALPPREAWRVIRTDGLFPYLAIEFGDKPVPTYVRVKQQPSAKSAVLARQASKPAATVPPAGPRTAWRSTDVAIPRFTDSGQGSRVPSSRYLADSSTPPPPQRQPVASASAAGAQKSTLTLPPPVAKPSAASNASTLAKISPRSAPSASASTSKLGAPPTTVAEKKQMSSTSSAPPPSAPAAKPSPEPLASSKPSAAPPEKTAPTPEARPAITDLPYGIPVPGRPGLVNSPYAGKNQLVDVTGIGVGQEVKCPYSGKLFKVPAAQQAANTVKIPTEPPAEPKKEEKKP